MSITFMILVWLLPLTTCNIQVNNSINVTTGTEEPGSVSTLNQVASQEVSTSKPPSAVLDLNITESVMEDEPSLQTGTTSPPPMFLPDNQRAATPTSSPPLSSTPSSTQSSNSGMSWTNFSTGSINATTEQQVTNTDVTSHTPTPTTTAWVPPAMSTSTESQSANDTATSLPSHSTESPKFTSTEPVQSTSTSPGTGDEATKSKGLPTTSKTTAKTPFVRITRAKKRQDPPKNNAESDKASKHGKVVAGIIGGALILMMIGFLVIFIKKRKLQQQKIATSDWAGPSPFLEGGDDNSGVRLRSSNQISLTSFLPQRLSKRFSMQPDVDEDKTPGTTFGLDGNDEESNGTAVVVSDMNGTKDVPKIAETSLSSSQTNLLSTDDNLEVADPPNQTEAPENKAE